MNLPEAGEECAWRAIKKGERTGIVLVTSFGSIKSSEKELFEESSGVKKVVGGANIGAKLGHCM